MSENERKPQDQQGEDQTEKYEQDPDFFKGDNAPTTDAIESNHFGTLFFNLLNYLLLHFLR